MAQPQEYKIAKVSPKVKDWEGSYGPMKTYYVLLEGQGQDPVEINKKPDSPAPKEGDTLYGDMQETKFGYRFKAVKRDFQGKGGYQPRDDKDIRAQAVVKAATAFVAATWQPTPLENYSPNLPTDDQIVKEKITNLATHLYNLVDQLKSGSTDKAAVEKVMGGGEEVPSNDGIPF